MIQIEHLREIDLAADVVWAEVRHFDRVLNWVPGGADSSITLTGEGVGALRDIKLSTQGYVQHRLQSFDDDARCFSYVLTAGMPLGMQDYQVTASVTPLGEGRCSLRWAGEMTADGTLDEAVVGEALEIALANMTTGIIAVLKDQSPQFTSQPQEDWQLHQK